MRKHLIVLTLLAATVPFGAHAQTSTTSPMPAPKADADKNAPLPGANSFTEGQAKSRLEANGYTNIGELKKDDNGVWKGTATHSGATVTVSVDYRGNITRN
jgi:putative membrane protein